MAFIKVIFLLLVIYVLLPMFVRVLLCKQLLSIVEKSGYACLTFDDGPDAESTPQILDILRRAGAKATFFVLGEKVEKHPELTARIVNEGHELGEHSYRHLHPWKCNPFRSAMDLLRGKRSLVKYGSSDHKTLFRPPYGKLNLITVLYIFLMQRVAVFWNINPKDYQEYSSANVAHTVLNKLRPGSIVLLHDGRRAPNRSTHVTVSALELILETTKGSELRFTTVGEALEHRNI